MKTLLVANRGEIALRVFRSARKLGLRCAAVYSAADADAPFVRAADDAFAIGPASASDSYLNMDKVLEAAKLAGADLIHPGYGFLAENAAFAEECRRAGMTFVGPSPEVLRLMGSKSAAKQVAVEAGVPTLPAHHADQSDEALAEWAAAAGYPVILKPAEGGGGKGMVVARTAFELDSAIESSRRIAQAAFGDSKLMLEKYVTNARHVEVQLIGDSFGNMIHLWERDCSLQRRHQKILEESPSPAIDAVTRDQITRAAVHLALAAGYTGAGTCEFVVDEEMRFYFLEMNARLQVEHPVTELVTGLDLVALQLQVAMGERLPLGQEDVQRTGHAAEVRVYAEDPHSGFLPQAGSLIHIRWPKGVRVDAAFEDGDWQIGEPGAAVITPHYDPMIAKIIALAPTRDLALDALAGALSETELLGVATNIGFLKEMVSHPVVREGRVTTAWLESLPRSEEDDAPPGIAAAVAAAAEVNATRAAGGLDPWDGLGPWRLGGPSRTGVALIFGSEEMQLWVEESSDESTNRIRSGTRPGEWLFDGTPALAFPEQRWPWSRRTGWYVWWMGRHHRFELGHLARGTQAGAAHLDAPMPGQVTKIRVAAGDKVRKGEELVVVEAMKMEHSIAAPSDGAVIAVLCRLGEQVERGKTLVDFESD